MNFFVSIVEGATVRPDTSDPNGYADEGRARARADQIAATGKAAVVTRDEQEVYRAPKDDPALFRAYEEALVRLTNPGMGPGRPGH